MTTSTEPTVAKLRTPADIIASVPILLGFHPTESIVVITLHGPRQRSGLTMRCNLPGPDHDVADMARRLSEPITRQNAVAVVIVCFSSAPDVGDRLPHHDLVHNLIGCLSAENVGYLAALLVRDGSWWHYGVGEDEQSAHGTSLPDTPSSELTAIEARRVMEGRAVLGSREELAATVAGPKTIRLAVMEHACETAMAVFAEEILADGDHAAAVRTLQLAHTAFEAHRDGTDPNDDVVARVLAGLAIRNTRDALMTWGVDDGYDTDEFVAFLIMLARRAPDSYAAPICTALAAVAYHNHECGVATVAIERALRCDPAYYMARLLDTGFQGQVGPPVVREMLVDTRQTLRDCGLPWSGREQP